MQLEDDTTRLPPLSHHLASQKKLKSEQKVPSGHFLSFAKHDPFFQQVDKQIYDNSQLSSRKRNIQELRTLSTNKHLEMKQPESVRHRSTRMADLKQIAELPQSETHRNAYLRAPPALDLGWMRRSKNNKFLPGMTAITPQVGIVLGKCKESSRAVGAVLAYCANTHQGLVRQYNEDRVSIVLNMMPPKKKIPTEQPWPRCSLYAIFDGHGGTRCADFLRDNLHQLLVAEPTLPTEPELALKNALLCAEQLFLKQCLHQPQLDRSGTCALVALVVDHVLVIANIGDSRAFLVKDKCTTIQELTQDHKPSLFSEHERIVQAGGKVYQSTIRNQQGGLVIGPIRVMPGRLSVSRTLGDVEAKTPALGGLPGVISAEPEIRRIDLQEEQAEFLFMGCDGIFDRLSNEDVLKQCFVSHFDKSSKSPSAAEFLRGATVSTIQQAFLQRTTDNVTVLMLAFAPLSSALCSLNAPPVPRVLPFL